MVNLRDKKRYILCSFDVGDLVRLNEDKDLQIGYGLVTEVRENFDDVYDLLELSQRIDALKNIIELRDDDFYPTKPQVLVLWNKSIFPDVRNKQLWMYASEITIVQKVLDS
jgi:hypothetical protein